MGAYLITGSILLVYLVLVWFLGTWIHLQGGSLWLLRGLLWLFGFVGAGGFIYFYRKNKQTFPADAGGAAGPEIDQRVHEALGRLRACTQSKSNFGDQTLVLVLGPSGSTKTSIIQNSGLDPDLLSGHIDQDGNIPPTRSVNLFYTRHAVFADVGGSLLEQPGGVKRLLVRLQPNNFSRAVRSGEQSPRTVIACIGCDALQSGAARKINAALHEVARVLGSDYAVYVLFTKLDRVKGFTEYVQGLSKEEATQVLGVTLALRRSGTGVYAEEENARVSRSFDELFFSLAEKRTEFLAREVNPAKFGAIYEFPRELRKLRAPLVQFLVDVCRPTQMPNNPILRGFYFCGVRPVIIEDQVAGTLQGMPSAAAGDRGATRMFSFDQMAAAAPAVKSVATARKVPQWAFVPHLMSDVVLRDRMAMAASGFSSSVSVIRRALLAAASMMLVGWIAVTAAAFFENRALQQRVMEASAQLPEAPLGEAPSLLRLQTLDEIRAVLQLLEQYQKEGAPWHMRMGLYSGNSFYPEARRVYFARFNSVLFSSTRENLLENLRSLPVTPDASRDYSTAYTTLKAYLITTVHPEKSEKPFLPLTLFSNWPAGKQLDDASAKLAQKQFEYYADALLANDPPLEAKADETAVEHARVYLRAMGGGERLYQTILAEAAKASEPLNFNKRFGSAEVLVDNVTVPGAFSKAGFERAQFSLSHLKDTLSKEEWVLPSQGSGESMADLEERLRARYEQDYIDKWRTFLQAARIPKFTGGYGDAARKLEMLANPPHPLLALFAMISDNTSGTSLDIAKQFQPALATVPAGSSPLVQSTNQGYIAALGNVAAAIKNVSLAAPNDQAAAAQQAIPAVTAASGAPREVAQRFEPDQVNHTAATAFALLQEPFRQAEDVLKPSPGPLNAAGQAFCNSIIGLMNKFPFNSNANDEATVEEVGAVFAPGRTMSEFYTQRLQKYLVRLSSQYGAAPGGAISISPNFIRWFNAMTAFQETLYPAGSQQPRITFSLTQSSKNRFTDLVTTVASDKISGSGARKVFTWTPGGPGITFNATGVNQDYQGPWALFHFAADAEWQSLNGTPELRFAIQTNGRQQYFEDRTPKIVYYELGGMANPDVLGKAHMASLKNCVARIANR